MNTHILTLSSVLAAVLALVILPVSTAAAGVTFLVSGILAVFVADYGRSIEPLKLRAEIIPFNANGPLTDGLSEAA
ncbi:MAG: hypothetical protein ABSF76_11875 [Opitutaceae bacterium]|jgi:hypothetical protein